MWYLLIREGMSSQGGVNTPTQAAACYGTAVNAPIQERAKTRRHVSDPCHLAMGSGLVGVSLPYRSNWVLASQTRPREDWVPTARYVGSTPPRIGFWPCSREGMGVSGAACQAKHIGKREREGEQGGVDPHADYSLPSFPSLAATRNPPC